MSIDRPDIHYILLRIIGLFVFEFLTNFLVSFDGLKVCLLILDLRATDESFGLIFAECQKGFSKLWIPEYSE
jgi:hypothetical protein